jgi:ABC-type multidrug transport system ATPase subunit
MCDHVAILARGRVVRSGPLDILKRRDAVRATFRREAATERRDLGIAVAHGFTLVDGHDEPGEQDRRVFRMEGKSADAISDAVRAALADGLVLLELRPELKDLETLLRESVAEQHAVDGAEP